MANTFDFPQGKKQSAFPRILITTDLEYDDMNGILLSLLFSTDYEIAGIVSTAGMFHFCGDGEHTLEQITPHYRCSATHAGHTVEHAGQLRAYRPFDPNWLRRIIDADYRRDYPWLKQNNPNYPHPDELLSITKTGNIAFEGDYRYETEGSRLIADCILDDDMRPLYIQHWGGINTTVRALYSIYETYHDTDQWDAVLKKVVAKVRFQGSGEDNCRADSKIDEMFPGLQDSAWQRFPMLGSFFAAAGYRAPTIPAMNGRPAIHFGAPDHLLHFYKGPWLTDAFKFGHGAMLSRFLLFDDGTTLYGEPYVAQYGLINYMDFKEISRQGYGPADLSKRPDRVDFDRYDWVGCQFECAPFVDLGLRQGANHMDDHYIQVMFEEIAARADWAVLGPNECNHAPVIQTEQLDFTAKPGQRVILSASVSDPDGDRLTLTWWTPEKAGTYGGNLALLEKGRETLEFVVPQDAQAGDRIVINLEVQDNASRPMTRFAQFFIDVQ